MNAYKFFTNVETLEDLRAQYKKLAMKHHPDRGGSTEDMQRINAEYEQLLKLVGTRRRNRDGETYEKAGYNPAADRFREIIEKIIRSCAARIFACLSTELSSVGQTPKLKFLFIL